MAQINAGRVRFVSRGEYNNTSQYFPLDLVNYNGNSYFAKENTTGNLPTDTTKWQLIAEKGNIGPTGPQGPTGNGIASITKTSTSGLVDTYTITYTNGTTTTFQITNGEDGEVTQAQLDETNRAIDYYKSTLNALPKVEGEGTSLTLDDTAEAPMPMTLSPSALEQATTTGKNIFSGDYSQFDNIGGTGSTYSYFKLPDDSETYTLTLIAKENYTVPTNTYLGFTGNGGDSNNGFQWIIVPNRTANKGQILKYSSSTFRYISLYWHNSDTLKTITDNFYVQLEKANDFTSYEPYTNGASPNPDYPQDIHTISGDNEIKVENRNLYFDKLEIGTINSSGNNASSTANMRTIGETNVLENTTYTISTSKSCYIGIRFYDSNKTFISSGATNISPNTFTTPTSCVYVRFVFVDITDTTINVILNKGSIPLSYTPHQEQSLPLNLGNLEYCKIGDYEDEFVIPSGSNIFDGEVELGTINSSGVNTNDNNAIRSVNYIPVQSNTQYTFNNNKSYHTYLYEYDENKNFIQSITGTSATVNPMTFTTSLTTKYIKFRTYGSATENDLTIKVWLNKGPISLPYEPYNNGKWYLKKNIGKMVLNGSETGWGDRPSYTYADRFVKDNVFPTPDKSVLSNYFTISLTVGDTYPYLANNEKQCVINFSAKGTTSLEQFKEWLSTHNPEIYYPLATPQYILLNDTLQSQLTEIYKWVKAYQEQTNISQVNNDLPFVIKASAIKDLNAVIASLTNAIIEIGGE